VPDAGSRLPHRADPRGLTLGSPPAPGTLSGRGRRVSWTLEMEERTMEKLKLQIEALEVTTFEAAPREAEPRGTVDGRMATPYPCSAIDACVSRLCTARCL
jgi:hypothetical protein